MYNKTGIRILKTAVVVLVFILVSLTWFSISASALENDDVLINGTGMYLTTGGSWSFYQGYELVFKGLSSSQSGDKVWIELLLNGESMDDTIIREGEYFVYASNSNEIFNITVDTIYAGSDGGLVTFKPVWQYLDPTLPEPDMTQDPGSVDRSNGSLNNSNSSTGDKIENTAGFGAVLFFFCMSVAAIFKVHQKKNR
ncbi:MAG: S-layer protein domain-containing protein [Methanosarcinaceae archaeon]|nr:S-layer protein domain-containing protein [Methanosarcinaceae archaeon]